MNATTLRAALEREHREIDGGIEAFIAAPDSPALVIRSMEGLRRHIYLEEEFLFPPLREAGMMVPIMVMLREHGELWRTMEALEQLLADQAEPAATLDRCRDLLAQLDRHNSKEEPIIYPRADEVLAEQASAELSAFLNDGRMPEGWVCSGIKR